MNLTVLVDNNTFIDQYFIGEPAVSYFIEAEDKKILFDAGYSDIFLSNAQKLGIDLLDLDMIVLSHGHLDHTWGLFHLVRYYSENRWLGRQVKKPVLIAHPAVFAARSYQSDPEIGSVLKEETLSKFFNIHFTKDPYPLTDHLIFLGEIERLNAFEAQENIGMVMQDGYNLPDMIVDDTALAYQTDAGLVIVTGCSHSGICNIVEYSKKVTGEQRVIDIIGGFHLLNPSTAQLQGTVDYIKCQNTDQVHACHCTDLRSKIELAKVANLQEVGVGMVLKY